MSEFILPHYFNESDRNFAYKLYEKYQSIGISDKKFISQINKVWQQGFWEMYLAYVLNEFGYKLNSKNSGPDILIKDNNKNIWVEATASTKGNGEDKVVDIQVMENGSAVIEATAESVMLRLSSSIYDKKKVFDDYLKSGVVSSDDIIIIAINGYLPSSKIPIRPMIPYIISTVFPIGDIKYFMNSNRVEYEYVKNNCKKINFSNPKKGIVEKDFFLNNDYEMISAILYSEASISDKTYPLGKDFIVVLNPKAKNPLPKGFFKNTEEWSVQSKNERRYEFIVTKPNQ